MTPPLQIRPRNKMPLGVRLALAWLGAMLFIAIFADLLRPFGITTMDLRARLTPPFQSWAHILGSDELGRDVLSRLLVSIQLSLRIAFGATVIAAVFGTIMGFIAAHFRSWPEQIVLVLIDFQASMPFLILALSVLAFFGNSLLLFTCLMGLYGWERYARIARGLAIAANAQGYAAAVRQLGAGPALDVHRAPLPRGPAVAAEHAAGALGALAGDAVDLLHDDCDPGHWAFAGGDHEAVGTHPATLGEDADLGPVGPSAGSRRRMHLVGAGGNRTPQRRRRPPRAFEVARTEPLGASPTRRVLSSQASSSGATRPPRTHPTGTIASSMTHAPPAWLQAGCA